MNYERLYNSIIERRRDNSPQGYIERHHIIPVSFGGTDDENNIVSLTAREHFLCHLLMVKMFEKTDNFYKALFAFMMMSVSSKNQNRITSRVFERYRREHSVLMSHLQSGENNSQFGKIWITDGHQNRKIKKMPRFQKDGEKVEGVSLIKIYYLRVSILGEYPGLLNR